MKLSFHRLSHVCRRRFLRSLALFVFLLPMLSGCVDYDLGITFDSQTHGTITQTLHVSDRLLALNEGALPTFETFSARAKQLSGKVRRLDDDTLQITLPFHNGAQLVERFNAFYGDVPSSEDNSDGILVSSPVKAGLLSDLPGAPNVRSHLALQQDNFIFALRNHLTYDLQIDPAEAIANGQGFNDIDWLTFNFSLQTPWGKIADSRDVPAAQEQPDEVEKTRATWHLAADRPHHIEAIFWVPSPIGIGGCAIALLCLVGYLVKHKLMPKLMPNSKPHT
ncbi:MAG: DUF3153 domain-containing protein [Cyanobacteria bacterium J06554_3]